MKKVLWYCKLCGRYDITCRKTHLIDKHNAASKRHPKKYNGILPAIFSEVTQ